MNHYQQEIDRLRKSCYANETQLRTVINTRNFINRHFDKALSLDLLSRTQFTSKYHLLRLFKQYYGLTPKQYLTDKRIAQSKACLKSGMTVTETCYAVGFDSPSAFSTLFRSKTGLAPAAFQKRAIFTK